MQKIMFNDGYALTQAVIEGWKTITRREPIYTDSNNFTVSCWPDTMLKKEYVRFDFDNGVSHKCRYAIGEILAVAQSYEQVYRQANMHADDAIIASMKYDPGMSNKMYVRADLMPHRIRITGIRCERLQEVSDEECMREGIEYMGDGRYTFKNMSRAGYNNNLILHSPREAFASLIEKVSGRGTWERNPWVVVYEFELIK